jgi:hypothetical protein
MVQFYSGYCFTVPLFPVSTHYGEKGICQDSGIEETGLGKVSSTVMPLTLTIQKHQAADPSRKEALPLLKSRLGWPCKTLSELAFDILVRSISRL